MTRRLPLWMICLEVFLLGACGEFPTPTATDPLVRSLDAQRASAYGVLEQEKDLQSSETSMGRLVFRSFKKQYVNAEIKLGVKLGWSGFGTEMRVGTAFTNASNGGLVLNKVPVDDQGAIFADSQGRLQTRPGEEFTGFCVYEASYGLALGGQGEISFAGVGLGGEMGRQKLLAMEVVSHVFPIPMDASLNSLESMCENLYKQRYKAVVQKDLSNGVQSQLLIHRHFDPRIQALEKILQGQWEKIEEREESWTGGELATDRVGDKIRVTGRIDVGRKSFHFDHLYRKPSPKPGQSDGPLILESSSVAPKTLDERYQRALILAGYLARNKAEYEAAVQEQKPYTVDDSLIKLAH